MGLEFADMKLTKYMREAFVRSAMNDVPCIDYEEQLREKVMTASVAALPELVRALWLDEKTKPYIKTMYRTFDSQTFEVPGREGNRWGGLPPMPALLPPDRVAIDAIVEKKRAQEKQRRHLNDTLTAAAASATTRKVLATLLPEFEKYLPADEPAACRTLPAITNIMADFSKAGWPKDKKVKP